jgi:serine/threonine protein kinase
MTWVDERSSSVDADVRDLCRVSRAHLGSTIADTYRVTGYLGSGGSSDVYRAQHVRLGKTVALKLLRADLGASSKLVQRFRREAKAVARLRSEHVVGVIDFGELPDQTPYLVMEFLEGQDLRQLLAEQGRLPLARAVVIAAEACFGLDAVHGAGLVHRDLKPENLFITERDNGDDWCKVLDFGVAKMESSLSTSPGAIVGTIRYMAPEQLLGDGTVGPHTDIYALGAILYECISGRPAHLGTTPQELMYSVMNHTPVPLAQLHTELPPALAELVASCLAKDYRSRPTSARALAVRLRSALGEDGVERQTTVSDVPRASAGLPAARGSGARVWIVAAVSSVVASLLTCLASSSLAGSRESGTVPHQAPSAVDCSAVSPLALESGSALRMAEGAAPPPAPALHRSEQFGMQPGARARSAAVAPAFRQRLADERGQSRFDEQNPYTP